MQQRGYFLDIVALLSGILFTLAFAPFDYAYLAPVALSGLFASWQGSSIKRATWRGYLFGLSSFALGITWVYVSIHDFGGSPVAVALTLAILFAAFWALFPAIGGFCHAIIDQNSTCSVLKLIWIPSLWVLVEYLRGHWVLNGFPWLVGGYSQLDTPLAGYMPIIGTYGTSFLLALSASLIVWGIQYRKLSMMIYLLLMWTVGLGLDRIEWTQAQGQPLSVALIQGNVSQDQKWRPEQRVNTLLFYRQQTQAHWASRLIVWPETAIPAFLDDVEDFYLKPLNQEARAQGSDLIVSLPTKSDDGKQVFNSIITLGEHQGQYSKDHLLPFGEYLPWQPVSGWVLKHLGLRLGLFTPGGAKQTLLQAGGYSFISSICYEDAFGDIFLTHLQQAAYLVNVTNDAWFGATIEPHQHLQIAQARAKETGRFMLRATNTGATAIINQKGQIVAKAPLFVATTLTGEITPMQGMTPYAYLGDQSIFYLTVLLLVGALRESLKAPFKKVIKRLNAQ